MTDKAARSKKPAGDQSSIGIVTGIVILVVSAIAGILVFTFFFRDLTEEDDPLEPLPGFVGEAPPIGRSAAADLLAGRSFNEMTPDERELTRSELQRVLADADFRGSSANVPGIDIFRRDGVTRATRQYRYFEPPGGGFSLSQTTSFYCDTPDGSIDAYRYVSTPLTVTPPRVEDLGKDQQPFQSIFAYMDLSAASDLGRLEISGRDAHGVEVSAPVPGRPAPLRFQLWIDVENARLLRFVDPAAPDAFYDFDWRVPAPPSWPDADQQPPCKPLVVP